MPTREINTFWPWKNITKSQVLPNIVVYEYHLLQSSNGLRKWIYNLHFRAQAKSLAGYEFKQTAPDVRIISNDHFSGVLLTSAFLEFPQFAIRFFDLSTNLFNHSIPRKSVRSIKYVQRFQVESFMLQVILLVFPGFFQDSEFILQYRNVIFPACLRLYWWWEGT